MQFELDGLHFKPFIPAAYGSELQLSNFKYRDATLDITIKGNGSVIESFTIDGEKSKPMIAHSSKGHHHIEIELKESLEAKVEKPVVANQFSLKTPRLSANRNKLNWNTIEGAISYEVYINGTLTEETSNTEYIVEASAYYQEIAIKAIANNSESFLSNVVAILPHNTIIIDAINLGQKGQIKAKGYYGKGFIELNKQLNTSITANIKVNKAGTYLIQARYSNGSGPDNTDNKCAIRTLHVNKQKAGVVVMPQRGKDEWSNWGYTNLIEVQLNKGSNNFSLVFEAYNENMNGDINRALLDEFRIIPVLSHN